MNQIKDKCSEKEIDKKYIGQRKPRIQIPGCLKKTLEDIEKQEYGKIPTCVPNYSDSREPDFERKPARKHYGRQNSWHSNYTSSENSCRQYHSRLSFDEKRNRHKWSSQLSTKRNGTNDSGHWNNSTYNDGSACSPALSSRDFTSNLNIELPETDNKIKQLASSPSFNSDCSISCLSNSHATKNFKYSSIVQKETCSSNSQTSDGGFQIQSHNGEADYVSNKLYYDGNNVNTIECPKISYMKILLDCPGESVLIPEPHAKCDSDENLEQKENFSDSFSSSASACSSLDETLVRANSQEQLDHFSEEIDETSPHTSINIHNVPEPSEDQIDSIFQLLNNVRETEGAQNYDDVLKIEKDFDAFVKKFFPGTSALLYGSYRGGYAVRSSFVDIEWITETKGSTSNKLLNDLEKCLNRENPEYCATCEEIPNSKAEKLVFYDTMYDFTCEVKILGKRKTSCEISGIINHITGLDERIRTVIIAARYWAQVCGMLKEEDDYKRLHPLCIVMMVVHFMQQQNPPIIDLVNVHNPYSVKIMKANTQSIGELWLSFLKYYSMEFNWKYHVVNIRSREPILKSSKSWGISWISIEDPFKEEENLASTIVSQDVSYYVRSCFKQTYLYFSLPTSFVDFNCVCGTPSENEDCCSDQNESLQYNYEFCISNFTDDSEVSMFCSACDEEGQTCKKCADGQIASVESLPKMTPEFLKILDESLNSVYEENRLKDEDFKKRKEFVSDLQHYVRKRFSDAKLEIMGSSANGFGFFSSDLDICMTFENKSGKEIEVRNVVGVLCRHLRKNREYDVHALYTANIPLVKFYHSGLSLRGDISLYNILAVHNTELLHTYSLIDERVRVLGCAMKFLAKNAGIADSAQRSLSSYSYILLVIHYCQQVEPPVLPVLQELHGHLETVPKIVDDCDVRFFKDINNLDKVWKGRGQNKQSVGELWLGLLNFYADFDRVITINQKDVTDCSKVQQQSSRRIKVQLPMLLRVIDPFLSRNVCEENKAKSLGNLGLKLSGEMRLKTHKTLLRARKLFGIPRVQCPSGFESFKEFFFHPMNLTDGRIKKIIECELCGKPGHSSPSCPRTIFSSRRASHYYAHRRGRGYLPYRNANRSVTTKLS